MHNDREAPVTVEQDAEHRAMLAASEQGERDNG